MNKKEVKEETKRLEDKTCKTCLFRGFGGTGTDSPCFGCTRDYLKNYEPR